MSEIPPNPAATEANGEPEAAPTSSIPAVPADTTDTTMAPQAQQPEAPQGDVEMTDSTPTHAPDPPTSAPTPIPPPTTAPPQASGKSPHPFASSSVPTHPVPHGGPTRVYLNQNVTPYLLEAMKHLVTVEPEKPLKWLSEYLAQKSAEVEGP